MLVDKMRVGVTEWMLLQFEPLLRGHETLLSPSRVFVYITGATHRGGKTTC